MSVTVKAYLLGKEDVHKEIRRFAVDEGVSTSFEYLKTKVVDVFSNLRSVAFQMYYRGELGRLLSCVETLAFGCCFAQSRLCFLGGIGLAYMRS